MRKLKLLKVQGYCNKSVIVGYAQQKIIKLFQPNLVQFPKLPLIIAFDPTVRWFACVFITF